MQSKLSCKIGGIRTRYYNIAPYKYKSKCSLHHFELVLFSTHQNVTPIQLKLSNVNSAYVSLCWKAAKDPGNSLRAHVGGKDHNIISLWTG